MNYILHPTPAAIQENKPRKTSSWVNQLFTFIEILEKTDAVKDTCKPLHKDETTCVYSLTLLIALRPGRGSEALGPTLLKSKNNQRKEDTEDDLVSGEHISLTL